MKFIAGIISRPCMEKDPEGLCAKIWGALITFFLVIASLLRSLASRVTRKLPDSVSNCGHNIPNLTPVLISEEEFRPPSPAPRLTEADFCSSVLKRLAELEEKVDLLRSKPFKMPHEKEELLNAAVCRVDAVEAELIATKKVISSQLIYFICCEQSY